MPAAELTMTRKETTLISSSIGMALGVIPMFLGTFPMFLNALARESPQAAARFPGFLLLATVAVALGAFAAGWAVDRRGCRRVAIGGIVVFGGCLALLSQLDRLGAAVFPLFVLLGLSGSFCGPVVFSKAISSWFTARRGAALGFVVMAAPMLSTAVMAPITQALIASHGWRAAYVEIGGAVAIAGAVVLSLFFWDSPVKDEMPGDSAGTKPIDALATASFWILTAVFATSQLVTQGLNGQLFAIAREAGIGQSVTVWSLSGMSLAAVVGSVTAGFLVDRMSTPRGVIACFAPVFAGAGLLSAHLGSLSFVVGCLLAGAGNFAAGAAMPYVLSRLFGVRHLGEIFGVFSALAALAAGSGALVYGMANAGGLSFARILQFGSGGMFVFGAIVLFLGDFPTHGQPKSFDPAVPPERSAV